jgi:type IV fimbrial biogenesis protein FimT
MYSRPRNTSNQLNRGFTLVELMITLAIMAILATVAVPSFRQVIASTRLSAATNELLAALNQAKSEAIRSGNRVTLCPSTDAATCLTAGNSNFANGWIIFHDRTRASANAVVDVEDTIFQEGQNLNDQLLIRSTSSTPYASFSPDGTAKLINGGVFNNFIRVCSQSTALSNDKRARIISIQRSGRIEVTSTATVSAAC